MAKRFNCNLLLGVEPSFRIVASHYMKEAAVIAHRIDHSSHLHEREATVKTHWVRGVLTDILPGIVICYEKLTILHNILSSIWYQVYDVLRGLSPRSSASPVIILCTK